MCCSIMRLRCSRQIIIFSYDMMMLSSRTFLASECLLCTSSRRPTKDIFRKEVSFDDIEYVSVSWGFLPFIVIHYVFPLKSVPFLVLSIQRGVDINTLLVCSRCRYCSRNGKYLPRSPRGIPVVHCNVMTESRRVLGSKTEIMMSEKR